VPAKQCGEAMAGKGKRGGGTTIVIKRIEEGGHGHHGGAWKVAYADFVTAMMAFFLLMWLLNATSEEQRRGLADYFSPSNVLARAASGSGEPFGGQTPNDDGAAVSTSGAVKVQAGQAPVRLDIEEEEGDNLTPPENMAPTRPEDQPMGEGAAPGKAGPAAGQPTGLGGENSGEAAAPSPEAMPDQTLRAELARRERQSFEQAASEIRAAIANDPALADLGKQLMVEQVPEGLRIQLLDADKQPMFALGSAAPNERARALLAKVLTVLAKLPNGVSIAGHTDAAPFRGAERSNWELSADRANAVRRMMLEGGIPEGRLQSVSGMADRTPLLPDQPGAAANRRVAITLMRSLPESATAAQPPLAPPPPALGPAATPAPAARSPQPGTTLAPRPAGRAP